jgi:hypothetical protein
MSTNFVLCRTHSMSYHVTLVSEMEVDLMYQVIKDGLEHF